MAQSMVWKLLGVLVCLLVNVWLTTPPALASFHVYHERAGQTTLRSQQSLRDRNDQAWQTILFKRYRTNELDGTYLRLVGFPGVIDIDPKRALIIDTGTALRWQASPKLDPLTANLPGNTHQYDVAHFIAELSQAIPLTLTVPLQGKPSSEIVVPPYAVQEWRELATQTLE